MNSELARSKERAIAVLTNQLLQLAMLHPDDGRLVAELAMNLACVQNVANMPEQQQLVGIGMKETRKLLRRAVKRSAQTVERLDEQYPGWSFATAKQIGEVDDVPTGD